MSNDGHSISIVEINEIDVTRVFVVEFEPVIRLFIFTVFISNEIWSHNLHGQLAVFTNLR